MMPTSRPGPSPSRAAAPRPERAPAGHGTAVWSTAEWRAEALSWLDERLATAGIERRGAVEQPHLRPWATVLKVPTTVGVVWLKAAGPGTAFEAGLYELLAATVPDRVLTPIATDPARGWIVLPDGGPPLGERLADAALVEGLVAALVDYGRLQLDLAPHVDGLLSLGVSDMRPAVMPERFEQALAVTRADPDGRAADRSIHRRVAAMGETVASWCERLATSAVPPSLDHNDLHPWNVLGDGAGDVRFYDWGDSVVAHPFAAMLVPLGFVQRLLGEGVDDPGFAQARDAYLDVFRPVAPGEDLVVTLELACCVAKIARVLTWDRAVRAAREDGEEVEESWTRAPMETLASLLDDSYLGGA
jgi:Phosphotransferase enzyme family